MLFLKSDTVVYEFKSSNGKAVKTYTVAEGEVGVAEGEAEGGAVVRAEVDIVNMDNSDNYDTEITWSIVGGFLLFVCFGVCIHYCCACRKRRILEAEAEERRRAVT